MNTTSLFIVKITLGLEWFDVVDHFPRLVLIYTKPKGCVGLYNPLGLKKGPVLNLLSF